MTDWTLRAVRCQALAASDPHQAEKTDFLGRERQELDHFLEGDLEKSLAWDRLPPERQERLRQLNLLLRNYYIFAEGFLVLGDELAACGDNTLAIHAFVRALDLNHPSPALVKRHLEAVAARITRWSPLMFDSDRNRERALATLLQETRAEIAKGQVWGDAFARHEAEAVVNGRMPSLEATAEVLTMAKVDIHLPTVDADRQAQVYSQWIEGVELVKKKRWTEAEPLLAKALAQTKQARLPDEERARLLMAYAASLAPQGGEKRLRAAVKALDEAELLYRAEPSLDTEALVMVLGNLEKVLEALGETAQGAKAGERRKALGGVASP